VACDLPPMVKWQSILLQDFYRPFYGFLIPGDVGVPLQFDTSLVKHFPSQHTLVFNLLPCFLRERSWPDLSAFEVVFPPSFFFFFYSRAGFQSLFPRRCRGLRWGTKDCCPLIFLYPPCSQGAVFIVLYSPEVLARRRVSEFPLASLLRLFSLTFSSFFMHSVPLFFPCRIEGCSWSV